MSSTAFDDLSGWVMIIGLAAHFAAGIGIGVLYFQGLWWNARLFAGGGRWTATVGLLIARFVLLGGVLTLASLEGAPPLLTMAVGILVARSMAVRKIEKSAP